jgi:hypothetical protein
MLSAQPFVSLQTLMRPIIAESEDLLSATHSGRRRGLMRMAVTFPMGRAGSRSRGSSSKSVLPEAARGP